MTQKAIYLGTCSGNVFGSLAKQIGVDDRAREITFRTFRKYVDLEQSEIKQMLRFPRDFTFYKSTFRGKKVYIYVWSMIDHYFMVEIP